MEGGANEWKVRASKGRCEGAKGAKGHVGRCEQAKGGASKLEEEREMRASKREV